MSLSPQRRHRLLRRMAVFVIVTLICCGLPAVYFRWSHRNEQRKADDEIVRYLSLVQERDRARADAMLCGGDDTSIAQPEGMDEPWQPLPIGSFAIVDSSDWSSIDGHGRVYSIRLTFADGSTAICEFVVEVIGNDPCIGTEVPF